MCTRQFDIKGLIGVVVVLGVSAMLAGPASAQTSSVQARTGNLHEDCNQFVLNVGTSKVDLKANCRTSDDNDNRKGTRINLSSNIENNFGRLSWDGSDFQKSCSLIKVARHSNGVKLTATCKTGERELVPAEYPNRGVTSVDVTNKASLELNTYYRVNSSGALEVR